MPGSGERRSIVAGESDRLVKRHSPAGSVHATQGNAGDASRHSGHAIDLHPKERTSTNTRCVCDHHPSSLPARVAKKAKADVVC